MQIAYWVHNVLQVQIHSTFKASDFIVKNSEVQLGNSFSTFDYCWLGIETWKYN